MVRVHRTDIGDHPAGSTAQRIVRGMSGYEPAHWMLVKLGETFLVMGGIQLVAVGLGWLTGDWGWLGLGALGPITAGLYLALIKPPERHSQPAVDDPAQDWVPQPDS